MGAGGGGREENLFTLVYESKHMGGCLSAKGSSLSFGGQGEGDWGLLHFSIQID